MVHAVLVGSERRTWAFSIRKMMIVVAVLAVFFRLLGSTASGVLGRIDAFLPCLAVATLALAAARLWPPHPPLGTLARQPGLLACGVATIMLVGAAAASLTLSALGLVIYGGPAVGSPATLVRSLFQSLTDWGYLVGLAVMVSWVVLGVVRGWRAEPNTFDRLGRAIGWAWVVLAPLGISLRLIMMLNYLAGL